jgi:integrase
VTVPEICSGRTKPLDAGVFQPEISSFRLHLAAEGKAVKTVRTYTEAVQWFAAAYLRREGNRSRWEEVGKQDLQEWVAWLLGRYSAAYASNQFRALQQFFRWLAVEEEIPDPMAGLKPPRVPDKPVPVFIGDDSRGWSGRAPAGASSSAATPRSSPSSRRPGYGCPS